METIKILRLRSGEDVVSTVEVINESILLINPVTYYFNYDEDGKELILNLLLDHEVYEENFISLLISDILWISNPTEKFIESYNQFINNIFSDENDFNDDINNNYSNSTIH